jgi:hypothetical protein
MAIGKLVEEVMKRSFIRTMVLFCSLAAVPAGIAGCSAEPSAETEPTGRVELALQGTSISGKTYRLRDGVINITGTSSTTVSTEDENLDVTEISLQLAAGGYLAALETGWSLEVGAADPMGGGTVFSPVPAVLTSVNPLPFVVVDQQTTNVRLQFRAGNDVVDLGNGRVIIGIDVNDCTPSGMGEICGDMLDNDCNGQIDDGCGCTDPSCDNDGDGFPADIDCNDNDPNTFPGAAEVCGDMMDNDCDGQLENGCGTSCNLFGMDCPAGQSCYPLDFTTGENTCANDFGLPPGSACQFINECAAPGFCGDVGTGAMCIQLCDLNAPTCSVGACTDLGVPPVGFCL